MNFTVEQVAARGDRFPSDFAQWLADNGHVWAAFEAEALRVIALGYRHYSARTILEYLRHHSLVRESGGTGWKLNNDRTPYLARLFAIVYPQHAGLFSFRRLRNLTALIERARQ